MARMMAVDTGVVSPTRCHIYCDGKRMVESCTVEGCGKLLVDGKPTCDHGIGPYYYAMGECPECAALVDTPSRSVSTRAPVERSYPRLVVAE